MPTDSSDSLIVGAIGTADPAEDGAHPHAGASIPAPSPARSLKYRATLFGSTLARVFVAVDQVETGDVVSITTNDP